MKPCRVDICITTYHRPAGLAVLLDSLANQKLPEDTAMRIIVVDNDRHASARPVAEAKAREKGLDIVYVVEPVQGISHARNCGMEQVQAPFMAFLDDDEWAGPEWLANMLATMETCQADVVAGPVEKQVPDDAPAWVFRHPVYAGVKRATGTQLDYCASGNVMIRMASLGEPARKFNIDYAQTGGEDLEFFSRLKQAGGKIVWCANALVYEHVPDERLRVGWILKRYYRSGQANYRIFYASRSLVFRARLILQQVLIIAATALVLPFIGLVSFPRGLGLACKQATAWGKLTAALGKLLLYKEYQEK